MGWKNASLVCFFLNLFVLQWFGVRLGIAAARVGTPPYDHSPCDPVEHPRCYRNVDWALMGWSWPLTGFRRWRNRWIGGKRSWLKMLTGGAA